MKASPRRQSRVFALQGLYQWLLAGGTPPQVLRNLAELEDYDKADPLFLKELVTGAIHEADDSRERLAPFIDRKWEEVSPVERSILLLGAWELAQRPETPYRVVINEAIELGKTFGGTDGHKYVNGILDRLAAELRPEEGAGHKTATKRKQDGARRTTRLSLKKNSA